MIDTHTLVMAAVLAASALAFFMGRMSRDIFPFNNEPETKQPKRKNGKRKSTSRSRSASSNTH
jgi:hypothetical protein